MTTPWIIPDDGIVDDVAVSVAASGTRKVRLTLRERRLAAERILAEGGGTRDIGTRLNMLMRPAKELAEDILGQQAAELGAVA